MINKAEAQAMVDRTFAEASGMTQDQTVTVNPGLTQSAHLAPGLYHYSATTQGQLGVSGTIAVEGGHRYQLKFSTRPTAAGQSGGSPGA